MAQEANSGKDLEFLIDEISLNQSEFIEQLSNSESSIECLKKLNKICKLRPQEAIEILNKFKVLKNENFKFKCITDAIRVCLQDQNQSSLAELLSLINNLIFKSSHAYERVRIRHEMIALKLTDLLKTISEIYPENKIIMEQIETFNSLSNLDEKVTLTVCSPNDVDLNNSIDIFHAINSQVVNTSHEFTFLCILRNLLRLDNSNKTSGLKWEIIEKLVCRATCLDREENFISTGSLERYAEEKFKNFFETTLINTKNIEKRILDAKSVPPPPPPPPLPPQLFNNQPTQFVSSQTIENCLNSKLPQQRVPKPSNKMRQLTWSKIPPNRIVGKENLWTKYLNEEIVERENLTFFQEIEELFKTNDYSQTKDLSLLKETKLWNSSDKINLLDSKRSLNINIYLKQFRCHPDEIVEHLSLNNENHELGLENLEGMLKILPDLNEIELLKGYQGEFDKLGEAEKFLSKLTHVPNFKLRIESLLLKEEFKSQMLYFNKSLDNIFKAVDTIYNSSNLAIVMLYICKTGNFLNDGAYCGDAAGFKLSSLIKLTDVKANRNNLTLLHVIINQLEKQNSKSLDLAKELLPILNEVSSIQMENLKNEVSLFCNRVKKLNKEIMNIGDFQSNNLKEFIEMALSNINMLEEKEKDLDCWKSKLADYFCEDPAMFKLEECFNILFKFCDKMKSIIQDINEKKFLSQTQRIPSSKNTKYLLNSSMNDLNSIDSTQQSSILKQKPFLLNQFRRNGSLTSRHSQSNALIKLTCDNSWIKSVEDKKQTQDQNNKSINCLDDLGTFEAEDSSTFSRRGSSLRLSRKSTLGNRTSPSPSRSKIPDSVNLMNFLSNGLESNRELPNSSLNEKTYSTRIKVSDTSEDENESCDIFNSRQVKLRRSSSTNEVDFASKTNYRRGITSALLEETCNEEANSSNSDSKKSNSKFEKLATMYRTFQDDDFEVSKNKSNRNSHIIKYMDNSETDNFTKPESTSQNRPSNLEAKLAFFENKSRNSVILNQSMDECPEEACSFMRISKLRHTSQISSSSPKQNIVSNRIMKFENKTDENTTDNFEFNIKRINAIKMVSSINNFQPKSESDKLKVRANSGGNMSSDDCEVSTSKDDGFETQSNASSSQTCDQNLKDTIESNLNGFVINISSGESANKPSDSIITIKPIENQEIQDENSKKETSILSSKTKQTIVTITSRGKASMRPVSTITTSFSNKKSTNQNHSVINLNISQNPSQSLALSESCRKKSGSSSGLYLSDTASTKAKRSGNQSAAFKITSNYCQLQLTNTTQSQSSTVNRRNSYNSSNSSSNRSCSFQSNSSNDFNSISNTNKASASSGFVSTSLSIPNSNCSKVNLNFGIDCSLKSKVMQTNVINNQNSQSVFDRLAKATGKKTKSVLI